MNIKTKLLDPYFDYITECFDFQNEHWHQSYNTIYYNSKFAEAMDLYKKTANTDDIVKFTIEHPNRKKISDSKIKKIICTKFIMVKYICIVTANNNFFMELLNYDYYTTLQIRNSEILISAINKFNQGDNTELINFIKKHKNKNISDEELEEYIDNIKNYRFNIHEINLGNKYYIHANNYMDDETIIEYSDYEWITAGFELTFQYKNCRKEIIMYSYAISQYNRKKNKSLIVLSPPKSKKYWLMHIASFLGTSCDDII